jgi:hypothetical protein
MSKAIPESSDGVDATNKRDQRIHCFSTTFPMMLRSDDPSLIKGDLYMQRTICRTRLYLQRIDPCLGLYHFATAALLSRMIGIEGIATGMQDIEPAAGRSGDLPGRYTAAAFPGGVQTYIYIIVLRLVLIIESQVANGAILYKALFYMSCVEVLISVDKAYVLQQLIEDPELFGILFPTFGILDKMNDEIGSSDAFLMLEKRELRMITQLVGEQAGMLMYIKLEERRAFPAIILRPRLSENKRQYDQ